MITRSCVQYGFILSMSSTTEVFCQNNTIPDDRIYDNVPKVAVSVSLLVLALVFGMLIAKIVDYYHDRRTLRDDVSDMSDHTKELLRKRYTLALFLSGSKKETKSDKGALALKVAKQWKAKAAVKKKKRQRDVERAEQYSEETSTAGVHSPDLYSSSGVLGKDTNLQETAKLFTASEIGPQRTDSRISSPTSLHSECDTVTVVNSTLPKKQSYVDDESVPISTNNTVLENKSQPKIEDVHESKANGVALFVSVDKNKNEEQQSAKEKSSVHFENARPSTSQDFRAANSKSRSEVNNVANRPSTSSVKTNSKMVAKSKSSKTVFPNKIQASQGLRSASAMRTGRPGSAAIGGKSFLRGTSSATTRKS